MRSRVDPLGKFLLRMGEISEDILSDVLAQQRRSLPFASLCYVLGHLDEEVLVRALSRQFGVPGLVLDETIIQLSVLDGVPREFALRHNILPVFEDERRLFVAAADPGGVSEALREIQFVRGKAIVPHVALHVTLARTSRTCYAAFENGETFVVGPRAAIEDVSSISPRIAVVSDGAEVPADDSRDQAAVFEEVTRDFDALELLMEPETSSSGAYESVMVFDRLPFDTQEQAERAITEGLRLGTEKLRLGSEQLGLSTDLRLGTDGLTDYTPASVSVTQPTMDRFESERSLIDLDAGEGAGYEVGRPGPKRVLIVDDDFAARHLLVKTLQPRGYVTSTATGGGEAVRSIKVSPPDIVLIDVMLPEIDGFQICKAIKRSQKYRHIVVILMSAVLDSQRVTDDVLRRYGADAYFEKPLDTAQILDRMQELIAGAGSGGQRLATRRDDDSFERAIALYKAGEIDDAMTVLRAGLEVDPLSAKHHFVLANLLQKKAMIYEAIDEYEATVDLKPDYFPALTRLAYLYYRKGFSAKAIEMWRRSLPYCSDASLRQNIEEFMRKLIANMQSDA